MYVLLQLEEEDVYDIVDEEKYGELVDSRRMGEDFVVDDGNVQLSVNDRITL